MNASHLSESWGQRWGSGDGLRNLLETDQHTCDEQSDVIVSVIGEEICAAPRHNTADCVWTARWLTVASSFSSQAVQPRGPKQSVPRNHTVGHLFNFKYRLTAGLRWLYWRVTVGNTFNRRGFDKKKNDKWVARLPRCVRNNTEVLTVSTWTGRLSRKVCLWSNK